MQKNTTELLFALKNKNNEIVQRNSQCEYPLYRPTIPILITTTSFTIFTKKCQVNNFVDHVDLYKLGLPRTPESQVRRTCPTNESYGLMECKSMSQFYAPCGC